MGDKSEVNNGEVDNVVIRDDDVEKADADDNKAKNLVVGDARSKTMAAIPVKRKCAEEWTKKETLRFIEFLGYTIVLMKMTRKDIWKPSSARSGHTGAIKHRQ